MAKLDDSLDSLIETLKRVDDESLASLSQNPAAQALYEEVTSMSAPTAKQGDAAPSSLAPSGAGARKSTRRRRLIWQGALVAGAAVIVLAVLSIVNVFGADGPSIVDKAAAALNPSENAILHVKIAGTEAADGGYSSTWTEESWTSTSSPYLRRDVQAFPELPVSEMAYDDTGFYQVYDAAASIIYEPPGMGTAGFASQQLNQYRDMINELLQSGDAVVDGTETVDGREVTRIVATKDYGTAPDGTKYGTVYLVDSDTKNPVEWRMTRQGGKVVSIFFDAYEQLPATAENLALLDLAAQHPGTTLDTSLENYQKSLNLGESAPAGDAGAKK